MPRKFHGKAVQSNILWLNSNKIGGISILQSAHKQGNPSIRCHALGSKRRCPCTQTASAVPKSFPCLFQFCTGYRIWHASRVSKRKTSEKRWFTHSKKYPDTTNTFSLFLDEFLETHLRPIYCTLTCSHSSTFFLGNNRPFSDTWVIFNYRMASFMNMCSISPKIWSF